MPYYLQVLVHMSFSFIATVGFGLTINIPKKALTLCGVSGMAGWMAYWWLMQFGLGRMVSNLVGAFLIGILGVFFARKKKLPAILFNIPGIVPLVPGAPAYQAVRAMVLGDLDESMRLALKVGIIISAIAMGFMLSQLTAELTSKAHRRLKYKEFSEGK